MINKLLMLTLMSAGTVFATASLESAVQQPQKKFKLEYPTPEAFLDDFIDVTKKTHEPLVYWAAQFLLLCQQKPELREFCKELAKIVKYKNPNRIGCLLVMHRDHFGKQLEDVILARGLKRVYSALEMRCQHCA